MQLQKVRTLSALREESRHAPRLRREGGGGVGLTGRDSMRRMKPLNLDDLDKEIQAAAEERAKAEAVFLQADARLRTLLRKGRAEGKGPSRMARLTGFTREWVAKIAPASKP